MTYKLYWLNKKNDYPQIDREYPAQPENISTNAQKYFLENKRLMDMVIEKVKQKEKERKIFIDNAKRKYDEDIRKWKEEIKKCGGDE